MEKLTWINPLSHHVYEGWLSLFKQNYDLTAYTYAGVAVERNTKRLESMRNIRFFHTTIGFYKKPALDDQRTIIGDVYTNWLCWRISGNNVIYYTEYFPYDNSLTKRGLAWLTRQWFRNRKFIVPTKQAERFARTFTSNTLYLPQLYEGKLYANKNLQKKMKLLFVGIAFDWKKNLKFLLDSLEKEAANGLEFEIGVCGLTGDFPVEHYKQVFGKRIKFFGKLPHEQLHKVYSQHNVFVLPSIVDPIGAVVLEAMAHGLPILVSDKVGANSYIENGKNGYLFTPTEKDLHDKLFLLSKPALRAKMGKRSLEIVRNNHWLGNPKISEKYYSDLEKLFSK